MEYYWNNTGNTFYSHPIAIKQVETDPMWHLWWHDCVFFFSVNIRFSALLNPQAHVNANIYNDDQQIVASYIAR